MISVRPVKKSRKVESEVLKLNSQDMALFGLCPQWDEFYLVSCKLCHKLLKPQAFKFHLERIHSEEISEKERKSGANSQIDSDNKSSSVVYFNESNKNSSSKATSVSSQQISRNAKNGVYHSHSSSAMSCSSSSKQIKSGKRKHCSSFKKNSKFGSLMFVKSADYSCIEGSNKPFVVVPAHKTVLSFQKQSAPLILAASDILSVCESKEEETVIHNSVASSIHSSSSIPHSETVSLVSTNKNEPKINFKRQVISNDIRSPRKRGISCRDTFQNVTCSITKSSGLVCSENLYACAEDRSVIASDICNKMDSLNYYLKYLTEENLSYSQQCHSNHGKCLNEMCDCEIHYMKQDGTCVPIKKGSLMPLVMGSAIGVTVITTLCLYFWLSKAKK